MRRIAEAEAQRRLLLRTREQLERDRTRRLDQARAKRKPIDKVRPVYSTQPNPTQPTLMYAIRAIPVKRANEVRRQAAAHVDNSDRKTDAFPSLSTGR